MSDPGRAQSRRSFYTGGMTSIATSDGLTLQLRSWSLAGPVRGTVIIVHGLGEHIGRYAHVAAYLNACGWAVVGYDQRGHGKSEGARGALAEPDSLLQDLALVIDTVRSASAQPLLLLGHSMGGAVAGRFVAEALADAPAPWWRQLDGLVLSSPALDPGMNPVQKLLLALTERIVPNLPLSNGLKAEWISCDPAVVEAYQGDPLVHDRITPRLVRFIVDSGALVRARAARWALPTLLLYAGADRCVAASGSDAFAKRAPKVALQNQRFETLSHEIFNEPEQLAVLAVLGQWLAARGH